jgi:hypothetical protein
MPLYHHNYIHILLTFLPWRWRQHISPKPSIKLHVGTYTATAVGTSNRTYETEKLQLLLTWREFRELAAVGKTHPCGVLGRSWIVTRRSVIKASEATPPETYECRSRIVLTSCSGGSLPPIDFYHKMRNGKLTKFCCELLHKFTNVKVTTFIHS